MTNIDLYQSASERLAAQADAVGRLAQDTGAFAAAFAAFESRDPDAFRWVLERLELIPHCELICEWIQIKLCALRCIEVCGPPIEDEPLLTLRQFAEAIVRLAENENQLRRLVDAVSCGDAHAYSHVLGELRLEAFCHFVCRWICSATYRRVCEVVCTPGSGLAVDPVADLRAAANVAQELLKDEKTLDSIAKGAETLDCTIVRRAIGESRFGPECEIICWMICVRHCVLSCRTLCRRPPVVVTGPLAIEEARNFALAARGLAAQPRVLFDLVSAVQAGDAEAYDNIVGRLALGPYCYQLCGWVCSLTCSEFCVCFCPAEPPLFTAVGHFSIDTDIDPSSGLTNKGLTGYPYPELIYHGGPNFAFGGALELNGYCPATSPAFPGVPMRYRFRFDKGGGPVTLIGTLMSVVSPGQRQLLWPKKLAGNIAGADVTVFQTVQVGPSPPPPNADPAKPPPGATWVDPGVHYITPDADGWVTVDPEVNGGVFSTLMGFNTQDPQVAPGKDPNPDVTAGQAVPAADQGAGTDMSIIFEATRTTAATVDYTNSLDKIHVNNWTETRQLNYKEFATGCCTPIDKTLSVEFTVDHEQMSAGAWSLGITSCSPSAPNDITPHVSSVGVTIDARGGWGTIVENTSTWQNCSYITTLVTRPGVTTGVYDRDAVSNWLTFAICSH
ncbi:MAG TPA: hypothetical protein VHS81_09725 [Caulobacteraceae bacterium]|nr:hypothetical protein [Caulobacteraceae bacterium]